MTPAQKFEKGDLVSTHEITIDEKDLEGSLVGIYNDGTTAHLATEHGFIYCSMDSLTLISKGEFK